MAIPEDQLNIWKGLGSVQQSSATYNSIKDVIEHANSPYAAKQVDSFLQGSYGNHTNIRGDSDVDIVLRTRSFFHYNIDALSDFEKAGFKRIHHTPSQYTLVNFKSDVLSWLWDNYGGDVDASGQKALRIAERGGRRKADILLVAPHRRYTRYMGANDQNCVEGVLFLTAAGVQTINYPKEHSSNLSAKNLAANEHLKPTVRMFKNMRNKMLENGIIRPGTAPSYFIEGMLSNVPPGHFSANCQQTVGACFGWINQSDYGSLMCANGIHPLSRDNIATSWSVQGFVDFLNGVETLWTQW